MAPAGAGAGLAKTHPRPHPRSRGKPARGKTRGWISGPAPAPAGFRAGLGHPRVSSTSPPRRACWPPPSSCSRPQPPRHACRSLPPPCWRPPPPCRARRPHLRHRAVYAVGCAGEGIGEIRPASCPGGRISPPQRRGKPRRRATAAAARRRRPAPGQGGGGCQGGKDQRKRKEETFTVGPRRLRRHGPLGVRLQHGGGNAPALPHRARLRARGGPGGGGEIRPPGQAAGRRAP